MKKELLLQNLVEKAKKGDIDSFGKIYELLVEDIFRYIYFKVQKEDAGDLCEDVFLKVWDHIGKYKQHKSASFRSWVFRIAHNVVIDYYRTNKNQIPLEEIIPLEDTRDDNRTESDTNASLNLALLQKAIVQLKEEYQQVIILRFINDLSNQEIAHSMNKSQGAVRLLIHRALKELKGKLQDLSSQDI